MRLKMDIDLLVNALNTMDFSDFPEITGFRKTTKSLQEVPNSVTVLCTETSRNFRANLLVDFVNAFSKLEIVSQSKTMHNFYVRARYIGNGEILKFFIKPDPSITTTRTGLSGTLFVKTNNTVVYNNETYYEFNSSKDLKDTVLKNIKDLNLSETEEDFIVDVFESDLDSFRFEHSRPIEALLVPFGEVITALSFLEGISSLPGVSVSERCSVLFPASSNNPQSDFLVRYGDIVYPISSKTGKGHPMAILPMLRKMDYSDIPNGKNFKPLRDLKDLLDSGLPSFGVFFYYALDKDIIKALKKLKMTPEDFFKVSKELSETVGNNLDEDGVLRVLEGVFEDKFSRTKALSNFPVCIPYLGVKKFCSDVNDEIKFFILSLMDTSLFQARLNLNQIRKGRLEVDIVQVSAPSKITFGCPSGSNDFKLSHGALGVSV